MPKRIIKQFLPDHEKLREHKQLKWLGKLLDDPNLLHLNRTSVSGATSVGLFVALMPAPFQMVIAALFAFLFRVNLPISIVLVWISNPLTMPPIFYFCYLVGAWILQVPVSESEFEMTTQWIMNELWLIWQPLVLGSLLVGTVLAVAGNILIRLMWRMHVIRNWKERKARKAKKTENPGH